ncbi:MAG: beta-lactamase family protein [Bacilli bacterium]|nr:beta-lactamase family protein [Bacilli bacterium]
MENLNNLKSNQLDELKKQYRTLLDKYNCHGFAYYDSSNQLFDLPIYIGNVHEHTIYEAASLTKVMFAYLVLKLSIDNIIDLNTPLVKYVKDYYSSSDQRFKQITAAHILSHTTGLSNWPKTEMEKSDLFLHFNPGSNHLYSGMGYQLLQEVVEKITNKSIIALFDEYIFTPFNLTSSSLVYLDSMKNYLTLSYNKQGNKHKDRRIITTPNVAYSLHTTIEDYIKFVKAVFVNGDKRIKELFNKKIIMINYNLSWNLGISSISVKNREILWQWGDNGNFKNLFLFNSSTNNFKLYFSNSFNGLNIIFDILNEEVEKENNTSEDKKAIEAVMDYISIVE